MKRPVSMGLALRRPMTTSIADCKRTQNPDGKIQEDR
jgi:hypothetical protein